jgi:hypothetical protein
MEMNGKLFGSNTWQALVALNKALAAFDQYGMRVSPSAMEKLPEIRKKLSELEVAWQRCLELQPDTLKKWSLLEQHVLQQRNFVKGVEALAARTEKEIQTFAIKEAGYKSGRDIFLSPYRWVGGESPIAYGFGVKPRVATWIYGARSQYAKMSASFTLSAPSSNDWELVICGQDDDSAEPCHIRLKVNEQVVFEGGNPLKKGEWSRHVFPIKAAWLNCGENVLVIENLGDSGSETSAPWFMLNYAMLRQWVQ